MSSVVTNENKDHLLNYEGVKTLITNIKAEVDKSRLMPIGTSSSTNSTTSKTVTVSPAITSLTAGTRIAVKFSNAHTASSLSLNVNGLGAKTCYFNGAAISSSTGINKNNYYEFVYDGTYWRLLGGINTDTDTNTWRTIKVKDTSIGDSNPLNLKEGDNITLSHDGSGNVTISATMPSIDGGEMNVQSDWNVTDTTSDAYIKNKPNLATVATSGSYNDLSDKPKIPTVNNGTLTITQNGTSVGTFTANQSGDVTIALTDNNTDTKVTSVDNHYTPAENTNSALNASGGTPTNITGTTGVLNVVTGLKRDAKGHIVGVVSKNIYSTDTVASHNHDDKYLKLVGGTLTGTLGTRTVAPSADETYDLGSTTNKYKNIYGNLSGLIKSITGSSEEPYTLNVNNALRFDSQVPSKTIGGTTWGSGYNNAILSIGRISNDNYVSQLGFTGSGLWYRAFSNEAANTTKQFDKVVLENGNKWNIVANTANGLTNVNPQIQNATIRDLTLFPKSMTLFTSGWNTSSGNYATTWGTTLDISYSTYYQRLAFSTTGRIEYFRGINSNNSDNTSASLTKVGDLAYLSDIPTIPTSLKNPNSLTIQSNGTTIDSYDGSTAKTINITQVNADWNETTTTSPAYIQNKPTIGNGTLTIKQNGVRVGSFTANQSGNTTVELTDTTTLPSATTSALGGIKSCKNNAYTVAADVSSIISNITKTGTGYCGVELDSNNKAFVYVPIASTSKNGLIRVAKVNSGTQTAYTNGTTAYGLEIDGNGKAFVKIPQIPTYSAATATNLGLIKVGSGLSITEDGTLSSTATTNIAASTTAAWYYPTFVSGTSATTENINSGFTVYAKNATSTNLGDITFNIGSAATDTVKAQPGFLRIFGESNNGVIRGPQGTEGTGYTVFLPAEAGTLVVKNSSGTASCNISGSSASCTGNAATATSATSATNASNIYINTSTSSSYYPMTFVTTASAGNTKLYIGGSTGTTSTGTGIRYNPSAKTCYCSGGFYEASDERLKNFSNDIEVDLDKLSKLSKKYFTWKDDESNAQHIGVSAQEVQAIYPELVEVIDEDGHLSVSYDKLSIIALKGIDVLNDKIKSLEDRLSKLEQIIENKF